MKVGFGTVVSCIPAEVLNVKSHYAYLEPAIAKIPKPAQEKLRSTVPEEVRRLKDVSAAEIMALGAARKALEE
jgi:hypothetical protein